MVPKFTLNQLNNINSILLCNKPPNNNKQYIRKDSFSVDTASDSDTINSDQ